MVEASDGRLVLLIDPKVLPIAEAVSSISSQVEILDLAVSGITAEEMVAAMYKEYHL